MVLGKRIESENPEVIRVQLKRLDDGRIVVTISVGHHLILSQTIYLTDSEAVTLEVADE